jgi:6-phosphogluconolactonase (cycloisomerase 2 family)
MVRQVQLAVFLIATLCTHLALSQETKTEAEENGNAAASTSPASYLYVSSAPSSQKNEINAFSVASDGKLTAIPGSPFSAAAGYGGSMAANGKYLFITNGVDIVSYSIASDGALHRVASIDAQRFNQSDCGGPVYLFLDRSGTILYDQDIYSDCANNAYQFFGVDGSTGALSYRGMTSESSPVFDVPLSFIGNNEYAYGSFCYHYEPSIFGFVRNSDGALTLASMNAPMPIAPNGGFYCAYMAAADSANHVAIPLSPLNQAWQAEGPTQLATYTAESAGNLTTNSSYANMPKVAVGGVTDISMSPSGKLLAVAGSGGLQVFHFNGANPITHYTGLLTKDPVDQVDAVSWDKDNHLYAISQSAGKLFVFTITPTSYSQAAGSPYTIAKPEHITVLAK